jgi:hypothetical protein
MPFFYVDRNAETLTERMRPFGQKNLKDAAQRAVSDFRNRRNSEFPFI